MAKPTNEQSLFNSLTDMHAQSSSAFERIRGIARCALRALETDAGVNDLEAIADALIAIAIEADSSHNDVSVEAEKHGIQTVNASWERRLTAMTRRSGASVQKGGVQ